MTTAVRLDNSAASGLARLSRIASRPRTALVRASEIQEKLTTNRINRHHSSAVTPPTLTTPCISRAPYTVSASAPPNTALRASWVRQPDLRERAPAAAGLS
jgi:hypothetical protein